MSRANLWRLALLLVCIAAGAHGADKVDDLVALFNPDFVDGSHAIESTFTGPATDIATDVNSYNWFTTLIFLPFLILPQALLLFTMLKFHDRGGTRRAATFMHHTKLENAWTAIPILTLFIVGVPAYPLLYKLELPPNDPKVLITVRGKQFAWEYEYKREGIGLGADIAGMQEPVVLPKGEKTALSITSNDVNHAWWVPAFGVKKDAINGRYNHAWFTPLRTGVFKGNCAELCGEGHGVMVIGAIIVEPQQYETWVSLQRHRGDTAKVFVALDAKGDVDQAALTGAVRKYFEKDRSDVRVLALRYWIASNYESLKRQDQAMQPGEAKVRSRRRLAESIITSVLADLESSAHPVVAEQE